MHHDLPASDLVYDLVSIQYHALKGAQVYDRYLEDAQGDPEIRAFFEQVREQDAERARRCHALLAKITTRDPDSLRGGGPYPGEASTGASTGAAEMGSTGR